MALYISLRKTTGYVRYTLLFIFGWHVPCPELREMSVPTSIKILTRLAVPVSAISIMLLSGCGSSQMPTRYKETYQLKNLQVVLLDEESLVDTYVGQYDRPAVSLAVEDALRNGPIRRNRVKAFYDFLTQTIYCVKWDFESCGHELHHALVGRFHAAP